MSSDCLEERKPRGGGGGGGGCFNCGEDGHMVSLTSYFPEALPLPPLPSQARG